MKRTTRGFTLIELLLGMTILVLVMAAVFASMQTGMRVYEGGMDMVNVYQSARIAMRTINEELQFALSANTVWQTQTQIRRMTVEQAMVNFGGMLVQEPDLSAVRFLGAEDRVLYCRKKYQLGQMPPFDIQECEISASDGYLHLDLLRSLTMVSQAVWFYRGMFQTSLDRFIAFQGNQQYNFRVVESLDEPPIESFVGDYGVLNQRKTIAEGIESISFRYSDGEGWRSSWNSEEVKVTYRRSPNSPNYNRDTDEIFDKKGPPQLVEVVMNLWNGDSLATVIEIPSGNLSIGANAVLTQGNNPMAQQRNTRSTTETPFAVPR